MLCMTVEASLLVVVIYKTRHVCKKPNINVCTQTIICKETVAGI